MEKRQKYTIGIDLGGTNTVFGIVDAQGTIVAQDSMKTQAYETAEAFVEAGVARLVPLISKVGGLDAIAGMGIGAPNANFYTGAIETAPNITWAHERTVPLAKMFSEQLSSLDSRQKEPFPVRITNDANAAAMGEMAYGAARGMKNFIGIIGYTNRERFFLPGIKRRQLL